MSTQICKFLLCWTAIVLSFSAGNVLANETPPAPRKINSAPDGSWIIQYQYGFASDADFLPSLLFLLNESEERSKLHSFSIGKKISDTFYGRDWDVSLHLGIQYFDERGIQGDIVGATGYWRLAKETYVPFTRIPIKLSLAQGLSYVDDLPAAEVRDFDPDESNELMHYLEYSLHYSFRNQLARNNSVFSQWFHEINLGYTIFHRSSVFGLFAETGGGINFPGIAVEFVLK